MLQKSEMKGATPPALLSTLDLKKVHHLVIYYLDSAISTPIAVDPLALERSSDAKRFETSNPDDIQAAFDALRASEPSLQADSGIDARWAMLFLDKDNARLLSAYSDSFGINGKIDDRIVHFTSPTFRRWLEGRFIEPRMIGRR